MVEMTQDVEPKYITRLPNIETVLFEDLDMGEYGLRAFLAGDKVDKTEFLETSDQSILEERVKRYGLEPSRHAYINTETGVLRLDYVAKFGDFKIIAQYEKRE